MPAPGPLISFVPVTDAERARAFYTDMLGLEFVQDDGFAMVLRSKTEGDSTGNMIRLVRTEDVSPAPFTKLGWESTDIVEDVRLSPQTGSRSCATTSFSKTNLASGPPQTATG